MEKTKNVIVTTHDPIHPIRGGGALRTLKIAEELKRRGHHVTVIAPTNGKSEVNGLKIEWLHAPRKQRSQVLSTIKFNVRLLRKFLYFISRTDVLVIHNTVAALSAPFLKKIFKFEFVLDLTDIHAEYLPIGKRNIIEKLLTPLLSFFEYYIIRSADKIIVVTQAMKNHLISKGISENSMKVVYDGADTDEIPRDKNEGAAKNVIHLGTVDRQHGVEYLIHAIPMVLSEKPDTTFFIVGGGRELENVKRLADKLKVSSSCVFTGYLPCQEAREYLNKCAIGIIPRQDNLPNRVITTLKIYEYWASRTAVISSKLEGISEISKDGENILFYKADSSKELAEKIKTLLESVADRERLQEKGYENARNFFWGKLIPDIVDFALK